MRLTVFGATGGTGTQLVRQALAAGQDVTAVVREPARLDVPSHDRLEVTPADVLDPGSIVATVTGGDAVVSALGSHAGRAPTSVCQDGTHSIMEAMGKAGVRRLVVVSNSGMIADKGDGLGTRRLAKPVLQRILRDPYVDMARMDDDVRGSDLDWTIVRPPMLTNGRHTGRYRTSVGRNVRGGRTIARANLADGILRLLDDPRAVRAEIFIAH